MKIKTDKLELDLRKGTMKVLSNDLKEVDIIRATRNVVLEGRKTNRTFDWKSLINNVEFGPEVTCIPDAAVCDFPNLDTVKLPETVKKLEGWVFCHTTLENLVIEGYELDLSNASGAFYDTKSASQRKNAFFTPLVIKCCENVAKSLKKTQSITNLDAGTVISSTLFGLNNYDNYIIGKADEKQEATVEGTAEAPKMKVSKKSVYGKNFIFHPSNGEIELLHNDITQTEIEEVFNNVGLGDFHPLIKKVKILDEVTYFPGTIFPDCTNLKKVTFPESVKGAGQFTFSCIPNFTLEIKAKDFDFSDMYEAFRKIEGEVTLIVPKELKEKAKEEIVSGWLASTVYKTPQEKLTDIKLLTTRENNGRDSV